MIDRRVPAWFSRAREIAARVPSPVGRPFAAKKRAKVASLYLYDAIGKDPWGGGGIGPDDVVKALAEASDAESLEVHVNSPGGYVFDGVAIYNAIRGFKGPKTIYVDGLAASIASIIALAGDKVVTNEGALWMIHDPWSGLYTVGTADEIEDDAKKTTTALRKIRETLLDIYQNATGQPLAKLSAWMGDETWMSAEEARERGFSDETAKQEPAVPAPEEKAAARKASPRVEAELARAQARSLTERFAGASPGSAGKPATTSNAGFAGRK